MALADTLAMPGRILAILFVLAAPVLASPGARAQDAALFDAIAGVLQHPRCVNCHPKGDSPLNGAEGRVHRMQVTRGPDGLGAPGARCFACHRQENSTHSIVPGAPHWSLAPASMGWQGLSKAELCAVLKDPALNGQRDVAGLVKHMSEDKLVLWGWNPGIGREAVPIPHDEFVALLKAWQAAGAPCPG